jgi:NADPH:quinone reductase-like Zn-dependent oxidoreductase
VEEKPVPGIGDNELLIKVQYVAVNPSDWKSALDLSSRFYEISLLTFHLVPDVKHLTRELLC